MTTVVDELSLRHARARALAASILDSPLVPRHWEIPEQLRPSPRRRLSGRGQVVATRPARRWALPRGSTRRRILVATVLVVQVAALVLALTLPQFHLKGIDVQGNRLLSPAAIVQASGLGEKQSIFTVDGGGVRSRIAALPWVTSVNVETSLPASVRITVTERTPTLRVRRPGGDLLVSADGATLDVAMAVASAIPAGLPMLQDDRPAPTGKAAQPLSDDLLRMLADTAARFPSVFGTSVSAFRWQADGLLTIVAAPGWRAVLGAVSTAQDVGAIPAQLAALAALKSKVDLLHPTFGYVDLEDPSAPAVGGKPGQAQPAPAVAPQPAGQGHADTPAATPTPATTGTPKPSTPPTPPPTATPIPVPVSR
jgi:cell division septal protein FtsQ